MLNYDLARKRNISPEGVAAIEAMQDYRKTLGEQYKAGILTADEYQEEWEENEYCLQAAWGFSLDPNYHIFWEMEGCTCPKMDNRDNWGTPYRVHTVDCPIHGERN